MKRQSLGALRSAKKHDAIGFEWKKGFGRRLGSDRIGDGEVLKAKGLNRECNRDQTQRRDDASGSSHGGTGDSRGMGWPPRRNLS